MCLFCVQLADQFCNAIGVLQQCAPPASFSNIQTAINKDQPANPTEGNFFVWFSFSHNPLYLICASYILSIIYVTLKMEHIHGLCYIHSSWIKGVHQSNLGFFNTLTVPPAHCLHATPHWCSNLCKRTFWTSSFLYYKSLFSFGELSAIIIRIKTKKAWNISLCVMHSHTKLWF